MNEIRAYLDHRGRSPFTEWFDSLDGRAAAKVSVFLERLAAGNSSALKGIGQGVLELRIDFGPGYRVYLGRDDATLVVLLGGGTKRRQQGDIAEAKQRWQDYKARKASGA